MIKLKDYIIDTGGLVEPQQIFETLRLYNKKEKKIVDRWWSREQVSFDRLDEEHKFFKVKYIRYSSVNIEIFDDIYVLDYFSKLLYD